MRRSAFDAENVEIARQSNGMRVQCQEIRAFVRLGCTVLSFHPPVSSAQDFPCLRGAVSLCTGGYCGKQGSSDGR